MSMKVVRLSYLGYLLGLIINISFKEDYPRSYISIMEIPYLALLTLMVLIDRISMTSNLSVTSVIYRVADAN